VKILEINDLRMYYTTKKGDVKAVELKKFAKLDEEKVLKFKEMEKEKVESIAALPRARLKAVAELSAEAIETTDFGQEKKAREELAKKNFKQREIKVEKKADAEKRLGLAKARPKRDRGSTTTAHGDIDPEYGMRAGAERIEPLQVLIWIEK